MALEIKIALDGLDEFIRSSDDEVNRIRNEVRDAIDITGREVINQSKIDAPKGTTSHLTNSHEWQMLGLTITSEGFEASGHARVLALYAAAQNFGIPGRPAGGAAVTNPGAVALGPIDIPGSLLGATPNVQRVRAHTRIITQAFGHRLAVPVAVNVRSHLRRMRIPATFFFSNALDDAKPRFENRLREIVNG